MLLEIRERAQGWVAWAIVILITIPFALWGIQSYLGIGAEPVAASVNGTDITERQLDRNLQRTRLNMRERLGDAYDPALFEGAALREQVLDQLIREQVLLDASHQLGLRVADAMVQAAIIQEPAFQTNGRFNKAAYAEALRQQGLTPAGFEQNLRLSLLETQLERALSGTAFATAAETNHSIRLIRQQRDLRYVTLRQDQFPSAQPPSDAELKAFYDDNPARFVSPEQVRVSYLLLSPEALGADTQVTDADLQALYDERAESLKTPERREFRHILISVPTDADESTVGQAQKRVEAIRGRILGGEDFAVVASEVSDDKVSAAQGGSLGRVERGMLDPGLEQVAFSLKVGDLSDTVRSRFGYHLVEVTAIEPVQAPALDAVKDELRQELQRRSAESVFYDVAERLATLTYEVPDSLVPAAEELGLEVQTSDWFGRDGGEERFANPKIVAAAFSDDVLTMGNNSELIEPDPQRLEAIVLRIDEHRAESRRPFEEVRPEIVKLLESRQSAAAALAAAEALAAQLVQGKTLAQASGELYPIEAPGLIDRQGGEVPSAAVKAAFELPRPVADGVSVGTAASDDGDAYVVVVSAVKDGSTDELAASPQSDEARALAQGLGRSDFDFFVTGLTASAKIEREPPQAAEPGE